MSSFMRGWHKVLLSRWWLAISLIPADPPFGSYDLGLSIAFYVRFFEKSYLPHSVCEECQTKFQPLSVNLLIGSFLLWQKRWDEAHRRAPDEGWMREGGKQGQARWWLPGRGAWLWGRQVETPSCRRKGKTENKIHTIHTHTPHPPAAPPFLSPLCH